MAKPKKPILTVAVLRGLARSAEYMLGSNAYATAGARDREDFRRAKAWADAMTEYRKLPESVRNSRFTGNPIPEQFNREP